MSRQGHAKVRIVPYDDLERAGIDVPLKRDVKIITSIFCKANLLRKHEDRRFRPTVMLGLIYFRDPIQLGPLRILVSSILLKFPRFTSCVLNQGDCVYFQEISPHDINMEYHVIEHDGRDWGNREIHNFLNKVYNEDKDTNQPLWKLHVINNLADGRNLLVADIDHSIGDGFTVVHAFLRLLDQDLKSIHLQPHSSEKSSQSLNPLNMFFQASVFLSGFFNTFLEPCTFGDSQNRLKLKDHRQPSSTKVYSFSKEVSLEDLKLIKSKFERGTINDVCMSVLTMALRKYLETTSDPVLTSFRQRIRASFPINLRKPGSDVSESFGNRVARGGFAFNLRSQSRAEIFWSVKNQIDRVKLSPQPFVEVKLMECLFPWLPMTQWVNCFLDANSKYTMMISNVPGPQNEVSLLGNSVESINFVANLPINLYCGILSYNGRVCVSMCGDSSCEENLDLLTKEWNTEFEAFLKEVKSYKGIRKRPSNSVSRIFYTVLLLVILGGLSYIVYDFVVKK